MSKFGPYEMKELKVRLHPLLGAVYAAVKNIAEYDALRKTGVNSRQRIGNYRTTVNQLYKHPSIRNINPIQPLSKKVLRKTLTQISDPISVIAGKDEKGKDIETRYSVILKRKKFPFRTTYEIPRLPTPSISYIGAVIGVKGNAEALPEIAELFSDRISVRSPMTIQQITELAYRKAVARQFVRPIKKQEQKIKAQIRPRVEARLNNLQSVGLINAPEAPIKYDGKQFVFTEEGTRHFIYWEMFNGNVELSVNSSDAISFLRKASKYGIQVPKYFGGRDSQLGKPIPHIPPKGDLHGR